MQTVTAAPTFVGRLHMVWDDAVIGTNAAGRRCRGAVTKSWFGEQPLPDGVRVIQPTRVTGDLRAVVDAVRRWSAGDADALNSVSVLQSGSAFRQRVWQVLRTIPGGDVITYQQLAKRAGNPGAMRAVGTAMAINAVAPFVPCHRVVQTGGYIGNYAYGADVKERMLQHEGLIVD